MFAAGVDGDLKIETPNIRIGSKLAVYSSYFFQWWRQEEQPLFWAILSQIVLERKLMHRCKIFAYPSLWKQSIRVSAVLISVEDLKLHKSVFLK